VSSVAINTASSGDQTIIAAPSTGKLRILGYVIVAGGTVSVTWKDGTTALAGPIPLVANSGVVAPVGPDSNGWFTLSVGGALVLSLSGSVQVSGHVKYAVIP
jgi:hypothetical protein